MPSFWYCLTLFFVSQALHLGILIFLFQNKSFLLTFDSIWKTYISDTRWPRYEHFSLEHSPWLFLPSFLYCLTNLFVSQGLNPWNPNFYFTIKLYSLSLIRYKKLTFPIPDDQDMRIFLYSIALGCSCLLFYTAWQFSSYLKLCNSEIRYFYFTIKLSSLPLI